MRNQAEKDTAYPCKKKKKKVPALSEGQSLNTAEEQPLLWTWDRVVVWFSRLSRPDGSALQRQLFGSFRVFTSGKWTRSVLRCVRENNFNSTGAAVPQPGKTKAVFFAFRSESFEIVERKVKLKCVRVDADSEQPVSICLFNKAAFYLISLQFWHQGIQEIFFFFL